MSQLSTKERRRASRLHTNIPTLVEVVGQREQQLHPSLAAVYERVTPSKDFVGKKFPAVLKDLSTNGAFINGEPVPLLSRIAFTFALEGYGQVEVLGWTLWRRRAECEVPRDDGVSLVLGPGFGVLFEAIPIEARAYISRLVAHSGS